MRDSYGQTLDRLAREIIGNCVPAEFSAADLQAFMPTKTARIKSVLYRYADNVGTTPHEITATNVAGEEVRLRLL